MRLNQLSALELVGVVGGAVAGVAGAISGVLALSGGPQPVPHANLSVTRFEPNVTRGEFVRRFPESASASLRAQDAETPGGALFLDLTFRDFDGARCRLTWTMHDDADDAPMNDPALVDQPAGEFDLSEPYVHKTPPVWIPAPTRVEDVYVVLRLLDGETPCGSPFQSDTLAIE
jgi:hypothetical protein